jgi:hypothetical protein
MGALDQTPTNVLGFGFSAQPFGTDARDATFCLGAGGLAILGDSAAARWLDLRQGIELRRTFPGARACAFDDSGALAVILNTSGLQSFATATGSVISVAPPIPGETVVVDSKTGLAYTGGGAVVDTATGQLLQPLPRFIGWDNRDLGFDGYLGIDAQTRRLVSYWYMLDLASNNASETGINYAIAGPSGAAARWGAFGVDKENHLAIMPWRYGEVVLIDMRSGGLQTTWTGGELYFGACAGNGLGFVLDRMTPAVVAVDLQTGDTAAKFASPPLPSECAYDAGTQTVWVLSARNGQLFSIAVGKALAPPVPPPVPPS